MMTKHVGKSKRCLQCLTWYPNSFSSSLIPYISKILITGIVWKPRSDVFYLTFRMSSSRIIVNCADIFGHFVVLRSKGPTSKYETVQEDLWKRKLVSKLTQLGYHTALPILNFFWFFLEGRSSCFQAFRVLSRIAFCSFGRLVFLALVYLTAFWFYPKHLSRYMQFHS